jgi:hypothetical protein
MSVNAAAQPIRCDILIVGGSAGGTAAALAAAGRGATVCLLEETDWLGGQLTVQGVCTPDENRHIETFACTSRYATFRSLVRDYYQSEYSLSPAGLAQQWFNPGSCWVSGLSYEPSVGARILSKMAAPLVEAGLLRIFHQAHAVQVIKSPENINRIAEVVARGSNGSELRFRAAFVLDATDTGELLPMCGGEGADWVIGAESRDETGEPDAQEIARRDWVQPLTFPFPIDWSPETADTNVIEPPYDYADLLAQQRYHIKHGAISGLFAGAAPWWSYRRVLAAENFADARVPADLAMINTAGNDYYGGNILGSEAGGPEKRAATLARARRAALGYLYWLQTECPREGEGETGSGYPEFRLRRDIFGTEDGCSIRPYIRESRRIKAMRTILESEIVVRDFAGNICRGDNSRASFMSDSVGIGHYALDIHPNGHGEPNHFVATRPFQIPLGALIPVRLENLLPACKNLGTTHLTNGAYRLHPIEWNIGEAAGLLALYCLRASCLPRDLHADSEQIRAFQRELVAQGIPLHWYVDVPVSHAAFTAVQHIAGLGLTLGSDADLLFRPDELIAESEWEDWRAIAPHAAPETYHGTRADAVRMLHSLIFGTEAP